MGADASGGRLVPRWGEQVAKMQQGVKAGAKKGSAKAATGKHPGGRPSVYDATKHPALAEAWATAGRTDKQIAEKLGVSETTVNNWKNEHPEFLEALKRGKAEPDDRIEACLFARAIGYDHEAVKIFMPANAKKPVYAPYIEHTVPDVTAQIFWLKNRRPERWREKQEVEHSGMIGAGVLRTPEKMSPEEWAAAAAAYQSTILSLGRHE